MDNINELAAKHLGSKQGDYSSYVNITEVDPSLLVAIPRSLNRDKINNFTVPTHTIDIWHGYEISTMLPNGYTLNGIAQILFHDTPNIIESKSMKLYWNTYNLACIFKQPEQTLNDYFKVLAAHAEADLKKSCGGTVHVYITEAPRNQMCKQTCLVGYNSLTEKVMLDSIAPNLPPRSPQMKINASLLQVVENKSLDPCHERVYFTSALRSNCRITNQPDFADVVIYIKGRSTVTDESLLDYITSFRRENHFHEECADQIISDLSNALPGATIDVACNYTRRGGWDICPLRTVVGPTDDLDMTCLAKTNEFFQKTFRQ